MPTGESEVFELCECSRGPLDRRASSVKWQSGMKGPTGDCTGGEKGGARAEGGDCRRKDGRAMRKGSLGSEGEKGERAAGKVEEKDGDARGRSNDALSHAESDQCEDESERKLVTLTGGLRGGGGLGKASGINGATPEIDAAVATAVNESVVTADD
ncbi:hypothetical protein PUN28_013277 [Cardiocondyla obscurior]|uniref:Uncharacterized protein n=1 Tax=Cardiocondyla obscurior TaxID=286306 RepID=A0AAW2FCQ1_9HYME